jgi:hypothetical protein
MKNSLQQFISLVINESLKKDIERQDIAKQIYRVFLKQIEGSTPRGSYHVLDSGKKSGPYLSSSDYGLVVSIAPEEESALILLSIDTLPGEIRDLLSKSISTITITMREPEKVTRSGVYKYTVDNSAIIDVEFSKGALAIAGKDIKEQKQRILLVFKERRATIIHEIAHMLDDLHLMGTEKFRGSVKYNIDPETRDVVPDKRYYNLGLEVNARWVEVIEALGNRPWENYYPEEDWVFDSWLHLTKPVIQFDKLAPAKQRKFIGRLWDFFKSGPHPIPNSEVEEMAQVVVKEYAEYADRMLDMRNYPPREYTRSTMQYLGTFQGCLENFLGYEKEWKEIEELSQENSKKIKHRVRELAKPIEQKFERDFANVAHLYPEEID